MFAIIFKLMVAGQVFFLPSHSRFPYGDQCEQRLPTALQRIKPIHQDAIVVEAYCEIQKDEVRS